MTILILLSLIIGAGPVAPQKQLPVRVVTVYHAIAAETDSTPLITADGTEVTTGQRICAVSQNMLAEVRFGDALWVDVPDKKLRGVWWVHDVLAKRYTDYVDLLVPLDTLRCWQTDKPRSGCTRAPLRVYHIGGLHDQP